MSVFHNNALIGSGAGAAAAPAAAGPIKSLRFNDDDSAYLNRTPSSAGNRKKFTWAAWIKRNSGIGTRQHLFGASSDGNNEHYFAFNANNTFFYSHYESATYANVATTAVFRDPSAWYHFVVAVDTAESTDTDRVKFYVNGVAVTDFSATTYPSLNREGRINNNVEHRISRGSNAYPFPADVYMTGIYFIDGSALDATSFGAFDSSGVWQAAEYTGTFGTNGFHLLDFANESTIGHDSSGNNNDFTANNFTASATRAITANGSVSTTVSTEPFNGAGGAVGTGSTSDFIFVPASSDLSLSGEFTIEWFHYRSAANANNGYMFTVGDSNTSTGIELYWGSGGAVLKLFTNGGPNNVTGTAATGWKHYAVVRDSSNNIKVYYNGVPGLTLSNSNTFSGDVRIGAEFYGGSITGGMDGPMSNFRIVNGSAVYTSSFTPPTSALTAITNTKLLTLQGSTLADASGINFATDLDILFDVPTNGTQSDTGAGGEVSGNYCILNPLDKLLQTLSNGNLATTGSDVQAAVTGTIGVSSGKYYWEATAGSNKDVIGIWSAESRVTGYPGRTADSYGYYATGDTLNSETAASYGATYASGDVIGVALDLDAGTLVFYKNGASQGTAFTGLSGTFRPAIRAGRTSVSSTVNANFGQRAWVYSAPSSHKALCTTNLPTPTIADGSDHFDIQTYTGTGASQTLGGLSFAADFFWRKCRSASQYHNLVDSVRGLSNSLISNGTFTEQTGQSNVSNITSTGYDIGTEGAINTNNATYVAWLWNAGANSNKTYTVKVVSDSGNKYRFDDFGTSAVTLDLAEGSTYVFDQSDSSNAGHPIRFGTSANGTDYTTGVTHTGTPGSAGAKTTLVLGTGVATLYYSCANHSGMGGQINTNSTAGASNFDGTLQATVKANPEAGFSIVTYTGSGSNGSFAHSLNAAPEFVIVKTRTDGNINWTVWHEALAASDYLTLNTSNAKGTQGAVWNSTAPTSSVIHVGSDVGTNKSGDDYIAYCFAPVAGYSAFGSYTGDAGSSNFVHLGFKPRLLIIKRSSDGSNGWHMADTARSPENVANEYLYADTNGAEETNGSIDILSNGFCLKANAQTTNNSGVTYVYMAWAENPFQANGGLAR